MTTTRPIGSQESGESQGAESPELIGEMIDGRYTIVEVIGEGGMGRVYRAEQVRLQRSVAVKVLQCGYSNIAEVGRRFEREAIAVARLDHPNCVAIQDFGRLPDGSLFLVMSYLQGMLLRNAIGERMPIARALHVARHLLSGLAHAHNAGIIHRDIKPDNVMLVRYEGDPDFAKIFDFGIAKVANTEDAPGPQLTTVGQRFGTPTYMSPEQSLGKPLDARSDLYSLSVVLYEMLTGHAPFESDDDAGLLVMHAAKAPPSLAEKAPGVAFPSDVEELVKRGLVKNPDERHATAVDYLKALDACAAALPSATPPPVGRPTGVSTRRIPSGLVRVSRSIGRVLGSRPARLAMLALLLAGTASLVAYRALHVDHAEHARALLAGGRPQEAAAYLEDRLKDIADDGAAQLELGHAYAASRRYDDALVAYERVRSLHRSLADDKTMRTNLMLMLDDERNETATGAARFLIQLLDDEGARARVVEIASHGRSPSHRVAMRELAENLGLAGRIDRLGSYRLDLEQGATCPDRQRAVAKLRALGDPAAAPALRKAQARKQNACLRDDVADAIRYLEPGGPPDGAQDPDGR